MTDHYPPMNPDEPDRPYSYDRQALLDWIAEGSEVFGQGDVDARAYVDARDAEVWDEATAAVLAAGHPVTNPYWAGRAIPEPVELPNVTFLGRDMPLAEAAAILRRRPLHEGDWTRTVPAVGCVCSNRHTPAVLEPQGHHLWPKYLGGPPHPDTLLTLCATTHTNAHRILRRHVKAGAVTPRGVGEPRYSYHVATLGFQAWDAAGRPA